MRRRRRIDPSLFYGWNLFPDSAEVEPDVVEPEVIFPARDLVHVSLFAGAGGFDQGFDRAGIPTVAWSEVEPHACAIMRHHYPSAVELGDITKLSGIQIISSLPEGFTVDDLVISGGVPCQDVSVAGRRAGLDGGERTVLFYDFARLVNVVRPSWFIFENVPGLLTSHGGSDFGKVLDTMAESGYRISYRVLDARYFGVPQRRRRIFLVGCVGNARRSPAEVLDLPKGRHRHSASGLTPRALLASRVGQGPSRSGGHGFRAGGFGGYRAGVGPLTARYGKDGKEGMVVSALTANGLGGGGPDDNLAQAGHLIPYVKVIRSGARDEDGSLPPEVWAQRDIAPTLNAFDQGEVRAVTLAVTPILESGARTGASTNDPSYGMGIGAEGDPMYTLQATKQHAVAIGGDVAHTLTYDGHDASEDGTGRGTPIVATAFSCKDDGRDAAEDISPTLRAMSHDKSHLNGGGQVAVAFATSGLDSPRDDGQAPPVKASLNGQGTGSGASVFVAHNAYPLAVRGREGGAQIEMGDADAPYNALRAGDGSSSRQPLVLDESVAVHITQDPIHGVEMSPALGCTTTGMGVIQQQTSVVRRLTPMECERLQGWEDGWTSVGTKPDGKEYRLSDSSRYKLCGNGVVATIAWWLAERIRVLESEVT